jgi:hypothetical protein
VTKGNLLSIGDVLKTNPFDGYWGCALVLSVRDKTPDSNPMCHIGITPTVFVHDYDFEELDIEKLEIMQFDREIRIAPYQSAPMPRETLIGIYTRKVNSFVNVIGSIDVFPISPTPLTFEIGSGTGNGWPMHGPIGRHLGGEAVLKWRSVHDRERWLREMAEAERSHEEMLVRIAEEDREKRRKYRKSKKDG